MFEGQGDRSFNRSYISFSTTLDKYKGLVWMTGFSIQGTQSFAVSLSISILNKTHYNITTSTGSDSLVFMVAFNIIFYNEIELESSNTNFLEAATTTPTGSMEHINHNLFQNFIIGVSSLNITFTSPGPWNFWSYQNFTSRTGL